MLYGYQGSEEDAEKLALTDKLLLAVLAEAQVVRVGQPLLIAGDLNADPAVISCLALGISAGKFVDLALAYSLGAGVEPVGTCKFKREDCVGSRSHFVVRCPNALAASNACFVSDWWFTPRFSVVARFDIDGWSLSLPSFVTPEFQEFFKLGRVFLNHSSFWKRRSVFFCCFFGYQGAEEDADQLLLTDELLQAVLAQAQVVCIGHPMLIAGDSNADPAVIPCLAEGISAGRFVDLALAYSRGAGLAPDVTCRFSG